MLSIILPDCQCASPFLPPVCWSDGEAALTSLAWRDAGKQSLFRCSASLEKRSSDGEDAARGHLQFLTSDASRRGHLARVPCPAGAGSARGRGQARVRPDRARAVALFGPDCLSSAYGTVAAKF